MTHTGSVRVRHFRRQSGPGLEQAGSGDRVPPGLLAGQSCRVTCRHARRGVGGYEMRRHLAVEPGAFTTLIPTRFLRHRRGWLPAACPACRADDGSLYGRAGRRYPSRADRDPQSDPEHLWRQTPNVGPPGPVIALSILSSRSTLAVDLSLRVFRTWMTILIARRLVPAPSPRAAPEPAR